MSIRRPHNLASIHHSPPPSHPCRPHRSFRHPCLRPRARWQQRYSTARHVSTGPSTPSFTFPSVLLQLSSQNISFCPVAVHFAFAILISCQGSNILSHCIQKGFLLSKYSNLLSPWHFWDFSTSVPANLKEANVRSSWKCLATGDVSSSFQTLRSRSDNSDSKSSFSTS